MNINLIELEETIQRVIGKKCYAQIELFAALKIKVFSGDYMYSLEIDRKTKMATFVNMPKALELAIMELIED